MRHPLSIFQKIRIFFKNFRTHLFLLVFLPMTKPQPAIFKKNIVVLGTGYWGKNHVRTHHELGSLLGVYDTSKASLEAISKQYATQAFSTLDEVFSNPHVEGVVVATPAATHHELAKKALLHKKDVLVEKPLALKAAHAKELIDIAQVGKNILMVGHLLHFHPCIVALKDLIAKNELGPLEYIYSNRLNLGKIRTEENILWSFAPHDISLLLSLTDSLPVQVNVVGGSYLQPNLPDTTVSTFLFDQGVRAHIYVSWLHPFKEQRLVVVGRNKMAVFDDQSPTNKLVLYSKTIKKIEGQMVAEKPIPQMVPYDASLEPLKQESLHFLECIQNRKTPLTDGFEGMRVLKILQSCQRSLEMNGQPVQINEETF